jgi:hypothetical protein
VIQEPLPQELEQEVRTELTAGERLLWSGRPRTGVIFRLADGFNLLFGIIWLCFVSYWLFFAYQSGASILFMAFGLPFLLVGLYMTVGRLVTDALQRKKMVYAVTNQRVIILQGIWNRSVHSLNLRSLPETQLITRSDGSGSIFFGQAATYGRYFRTSGRMGALGLTAFETIPNVRSVHEIILRAQREVVDYLPDET